MFGLLALFTLEKFPPKDNKNILYFWVTHFKIFALNAISDLLPRYELLMLVKYEGCETRNTFFA